VTLRPISRNNLAALDVQARAELVIDRVRDAKIVGLGGAKFPTATKLGLARTARALIINGMQSEPDNKSDVALLQEDPAAALAGIALVALVCPAQTIALALPAGMDKALTTAVHKALQAELEWLNDFGESTRDARQVYLQPDHAAGEEYQLAKLLGIIESVQDAVAEKEQSTKPLIELGVLCLNLATCHAIGCAVYNGERLSRRMVTVNDKTQWIDFGTPVA